MRNKELPEWAKAGATVWLNPHSYSPTSRYRRGTVTRVTKTSVFAKQDGSETERRFVAMGGSWFGDETVLEEYGSRGERWSHGTYLFAEDSAVVKRGIRQSNIADAYARAVNVMSDFTARTPADSRSAAARKSIAALEAYLDVVKEGSDGTSETE